MIWQQLLLDNVPKVNQIYFHLGLTCAENLLSNIIIFRGDRTLAGGMDGWPITIPMSSFNDNLIIGEM